MALSNNTLTDWLTYSSTWLWHCINHSLITMKINDKHTLKLHYSASRAVQRYNTWYCRLFLVPWSIARLEEESKLCSAYAALPFFLSSFSSSSIFLQELPIRENLTEILMRRWCIVSPLSFCDLFRLRQCVFHPSTTLYTHTLSLSLSPFLLACYSFSLSLVLLHETWATV